MTWLSIRRKASRPDPEVLFGPAAARTADARPYDRILAVPIVRDADGGPKATHRLRFRMNPSARAGVH